MAFKEISAGGVVYRKDGGRMQIQLITDRYGKISFAKGKREPGETVEQTALREILEETGIVGRIIKLIDIIAYTYMHPKYGNVDKEVHYYLVECEGGKLRPQLEEIRSVAWHDPHEAWKLQQKSGYDNNDFILEKALRMLGLRP
ncbi:NUDIX hydrolase [Paenibacillus macerans]|uniref:AP4A hydrolase n=1 Tax=Paenibacillus macerans TaxID=44252 RepID=A0A090ZFM4_PAEMA|nr:NUDIX domain-containing protein [Paenibacillus macerans]KFN10084.1 AP4A hydrolase [Paenibacillus macerans]MBS5909699.1 NUDIX domain-containing protein [Paenibacillus macerans]MCY7558978.1 NUDIX domain-containing protein [Paenibacillus macerans]MDU5947007.1 NUDIX domain-containing protein [Paenibacillus macerans]MDU7477268.1 NUDIX domain-containing protein [Paenibacillus macerans]